MVGGARGEGASTSVATREHEKQLSYQLARLDVGVLAASEEGYRHLKLLSARITRPLDPNSRPDPCNELRRLARQRRSFCATTAATRMTQ